MHGKLKFLFDLNAQAETMADLSVNIAKERDEGETDSREEKGA